MLDKSVRNGFGVRGRSVEGHGCRRERIECLLAFWCEACSQLREYALVLFVRLDLRL